MMTDSMESDTSEKPYASREEKKKKVDPGYLQPAEQFTEHTPVVFSCWVELGYWVVS